MPSSQFHFKVVQNMSRFRSRDSTIPTAESHAMSILLTPFREHEIIPMIIQLCCFVVQWISFRILPIVRYSGQASWSPEKLVMWVLFDAQMTGTIVALAGSRLCVSHHQYPVYLPLYIGQHSESARRTSSKSRCCWNGKWAISNWIHLKISLSCNVPKICEWSSIQLSPPSPKLFPESGVRRASVDWNDSISKLSSPRHSCWSIHVTVCWLNDWSCWKSFAYWNRCHGFHCSEYLWCLLYNLVALPYAVPPAFSTPTTCLWALVCVGTGVHVRSGIWGRIVSSSGVPSGGGAPGTLPIGRVLVTKSSMAIQVHRLKSNHDGSGRSHPARGKVQSCNSPAFINIGWYCW